MIRVCKCNLGNKSDNLDVIWRYLFKKRNLSKNKQGKVCLASHLILIVKQRLSSCNYPHCKAKLIEIRVIVTKVIVVTKRSIKTQQCASSYRLKIILDILQ